MRNDECRMMNSLDKSLLASLIYQLSKLSIWLRATKEL